ncbi:hypothetical protein BDM02DRAFT_3118807 [Thelephora ganbajun]|uniref:Uncharacterized protein n=1 Tax=Thelephora ganbajun TaxID=370292 RepID=A0ACB6ZAM4_THEGA|nr:hypothetical protein BDM02DRAFT_3118807 [Thelephora ganbajun]
MPTPELPPVDVDLQDLYEQVLAGFKDDSSPELPTPVAQNKASPSDLESLYHSYAEDSTDPSSKLSRNTSHTIASQPVSAQRSSSVQSQGQTPRRRLPPIPGNPSSSPTSSMHVMPEPHPYYDTARSQDS